MVNDSLPSMPQKRPLTGNDREVLHRVIGMLEGEPEYAGTVRPGLRAIIGDGTQPQQRDLTAQERHSLSGIISRLIDEWDGPRLPWEQPTPAWDLSKADIARLGLIWRVVSPPPDDAGRPLVVNAADWSPPAGIPDDWVVANAPQPVRGPASARAWQGEQRHGEFYAAWPIDDDDDAFWEESGAREVLPFSNHKIAGEAGRYLAACGLLPGEAGLTVTEVARQLRHPWKDGILDDEQAREAALAAILELRRDDEDLAYDGSDGPQRRDLTSGERAFLHQLIDRAAADPRWATEEVARRPQIRAALGDGTRPQPRALTARERDDIGRMVMLIDGEYRYDRQRPGYQPLSPWMSELPGGDVARLQLIVNAITPHRGNRPVHDQVFVNAADWGPPEPVPDGWLIANAPVPISGPVTWQGDHTGNGEFYAAAPPDDDPFDGWHAETRAPVLPVKVVTDEDAVEAAYAFLADYQCAAPGDMGMTVTEVAGDLGYPLPAGRADAAVATAGTTWMLRTSRGDNETSWYAVHGARARDQVTGAAAQTGCLVTPNSTVPLDEASPGARAMITLALQYGWDVAYIHQDQGERVTARNPDAGEQVSQLWDARGRLVRDDNLEKIDSVPRPRCTRAAGRPPGPPGPVACAFPEGPAAVRQKGNRTGRTRNQAASGHRAPPSPCPP